MIAIRRVLADAEAAYAATLVEFNLAMAAETEGLSLDRETVTRGVERVLAEPAHGFYLLAERAGEIAGALLITYEWSDWRNARFWWIQSVYVAPAHRRAGVLSALLAHLRTLARETEGVCGFRLYVHRHNPAARQVYERLGFGDTDYLVLGAPC